MYIWPHILIDLSDNSFSVFSGKKGPAAGGAMISSDDSGIF